MTLYAEVWTKPVLYSGDGTQNHPAFMDDYPDIAWGDSTGYRYTSADGKNTAPALGLVAIVIRATEDEIASIKKDGRYFINWAQSEEQFAGDTPMDKSRPVDEMAQMSTYLGEMAVPDILITELARADREVAGEMLKAEAMKSSADDAGSVAAVGGGDISIKP